MFCYFMGSRAGTDSYWTDDNNNRSSSVAITIANMPAMRNVRQVSISSIDLIIAVGGIFGIFFGMTILGVIELLCVTYKIAHAFMFKHS